MTKRKQVILLMTDTTRFDMLGCYGNSGMKTPNLDALAEEGSVSNMPIPVSRYAARQDRRFLREPFLIPAEVFTISYALGANVKTVGQRLRDNGIHTAYIGKYHLDGGITSGLDGVRTAGTKNTGMICACT